MYEEQNSYEEALQLFGHRVGMLCAFEISHIIQAQKRATKTLKWS